jgi:hypothetical protein
MPYADLFMPPYEGSPADPYAELRDGGRDPRRGCAIPQSQERGLTLAQLRRIRSYVLRRCEEEGGWTAERPDPATGEMVPTLLSASDVNLYDLSSTILDAAKHRTSSYVEAVTAQPNPPSWFISHYWGHSVLGFVTCVEQHARDRALPKDTSYWICAYSLNQHRLHAEIGNSIEESPFYKAMRATEGTLVIDSPKAQVFTRIWCVYEMWLSLVAPHGEVGAKLFDVYISLSDTEAVGLADGPTVRDELGGKLTWRGPPGAKAKREANFPRDFIDAGVNFSIADTAATVETDRQMIDRAIGSEAHTLEATIAASLGAPVLADWLNDPVTHAHRLESYMVKLAASKVRHLTAVGGPGEGGLAGYDADGDGVADDEPARRQAAAQIADAMPETLKHVQLLHLHPEIARGPLRLLGLGRLTGLELVRLQGGDELAIAVACALTGTHTPCPIENLNLADNLITAVGARALSEAFAGSYLLQATLRIFVLDQNPLGAEGGLAIGEGLSTLRGLRQLEMGLCEFSGEAGGVGMARAIETNEALTHLDLVGNTLGPEGAVEIGRALRGSAAWSGCSSARRPSSRRACTRSRTGSTGRRRHCAPSTLRPTSAARRAPCTSAASSSPPRSCGWRGSTATRLETRARSASPPSSRRRTRCAS